MSDEAKITEPTDVPPLVSGAVAKFVLEPLNYGLAAGCRRALEIGVPTNMMIEFLLNHLASVAAMVEPAGAREALVKDLVRSFASMVNKHVDARYTTPGGVALPRKT